MLIFTYSYPYGRPMLSDYYRPFWIIYSEEKFEVYKKYGFEIISEKDNLIKMEKH